MMLKLCDSNSNKLILKVIPILLTISIWPKDAFSAENSSYKKNGSLINAERCMRTFTYSIYLTGIHTGELKKIEQWQKDKVVVTSKSQASILGITTTYNQRAELSWLESRHEWISTEFHQQVSGFRSRDMQVTLKNQGHQSEVDIDGKKASYFDADIPLRDVDTLSIQIRQNLIEGRKSFVLNRQATDGIERYQYDVYAKKNITIYPWGEITVIPVEQKGEDHITFFFSPDLGYQVVKAKYHGFLLKGLLELDAYSSTCLKGY